MSDSRDVCALVVADPEGRWLQIRRAQHVPYAGLLCFPGGRVEAGESVLEALVREADEELNLKVEPLAEVAVVDVAGVRLHAWLCSFTGAPVNNPAEVAEVLWMTAEQIANAPDSMPSSLLLLPYLPKDVVTAPIPVERHAMTEL